MKRYIKSSYSRWESELENQLYQAWENYKNDSGLTEKDIEDIVVEHLNYLIDEGSIDDAPDAWEAEARGYVKNNIDNYYFKNLLVDDAPENLRRGKTNQSKKQSKSKWDKYDWYRYDFKNLQRLNYSSRIGYGSAKIVEQTDYDGYRRARVTVTGSYLNSEQARTLANALNAIADELDEFNANYDLKDEDF